jgi:hypothetical protein
VKNPYNGIEKLRLDPLTGLRQFFGLNPYNGIEKLSSTGSPSRDITA